MNIQISQQLRSAILRSARRMCEGWISLLCVLALATTLPAARADEVVRVGTVGGLTDAGLYIANELGFFKEAGLTVEIKRMANAPALVAALATDQLNVAGIAITPGLFLAAQQGIGLRIVGDKQSARPGFTATRLVVRRDLLTGEKKDAIKALRGKAIGISSRASSSFVNVASMLAENGVALSDVRIVQLAYPNMVAALSTGAVDAAYIIEPFLSEAIRRDVAIDVSDIGHLGSSTASRLSVPLVYSEAFAKRRPVAQAFMTAYMRGVRVYNDAFIKGKDKKNVLAIMARGAGVDLSIAENSFPGGLDPDQSINLASLDEMQRFFISQKMMSAPVDLTKLVDPSFAKAAVAELGSYR